MGQIEKEWIDLFEKQNLPYLVVWNKIDLITTRPICENVTWQIHVSAISGQGMEELKNTLPKLGDSNSSETPLVGDLLKPLDLVVLVVPIDEAAPKGRLILPQQQVIRDVLEAGATAMVVKDTEYKHIYDKIECLPALVITDSQVFDAVAKDTPATVALTSFSILMARKKGFLRIAAESVRELDAIRKGDRILIAEGCTHHRQCGDIGTVKLPRWICSYTQVEPEFDFCSGLDFPEDLSAYKLVIHCGGCMLNQREVKYRMHCAMEQGVPFTNYGIAIAHMNHILDRSLHALNGQF